MPAPGEDFIFMFDTEGFQNAVNKVMGGLAAVNNTAKNTFSSGNIAKMGLQFGMFASLAMGAMKMVGNAIRGVFNEAVKNIPELGQTFSIVSDIFFRNFFWPIRKMLIPMLQSLLDWTRKHRAMFIRWGQAVVNVVKGVITIFKTVIGLFKTFVNSVKEATGGMFGDVAQNIEKTFNVLIFKLNVLAQYAMIAMEPLLAFLGKLTGESVKLFGSWIEGFTEQIGKLGMMGTMFEGLSKNFGKLFENLDKLVDKLGGLDRVFNALGKGAAAVFEIAITNIMMKINTLIAAVNLLFELPEKISGAWGTIKDFFTEEKSRGRRVDDAIISDGKIITTNPADTIIATKNVENLVSGNGGRKNINLTANLNVSGNLNITEGNAEMAGQNFIGGVGKQIYFELMNELAAEGSY